MTDRATDDQQISAADVARLAGVTRAAVSNWRRRHDDFPAPVAGGASSPRFPLSAVRAWLDQQHKGREESSEVRLWHALRTAYAEDILTGVADVAEHVVGPGSNTLPADVASAVETLAAQDTPPQAVAGLVERLTISTVRGQAETTTNPRLVKAIARCADPHARTVLDPACGVGSLLLGVGAPDAQRFGQDAVESAVRLTRLRAQLAGVADVQVHADDALRRDGWPELRAELVVCHPPAVTPEWGREDLPIDPRWELALPPRVEGELAWLQHAYAHTAPGGQTIVVMSTSTAHRRTGRRIRTELVRRGALDKVVALPAGLATGHAQPVHLWVLRRPISSADKARSIRMVDLSTADAEHPLRPETARSAEVDPIDLLDDSVDLSPSRWVPQAHSVADYDALRAEYADVLAALHRELPRLVPTDSEYGSSTVRLTELAEAGLVDLSEERPRSVSDQLDTDFLNGFLHSPANAGRSTSASGTYRFDPRAASVPRMSTERQRRYGAAFRALDEADQRARDLAALVTRTVDLARRGLTTGALAPPTHEARE